MSRVSILVPAYNAAPWIAATLDSALAQTHPDCEVIVVDDGSVDATLAIARRYETRGVRVITQANAGAAAARNHALRLASGDFIQFLDADDLIAPEKIARQLALLARSPLGAVASCRWGRFSNNVAATRFVDTDVFRDFTAVEFLTLAGMTGAMIHPSAWLVPRAIAMKAGPWDESLSLNDDGEYFCRVVLASAGVVFCCDTKASSHYRSGLPGSLSQRRSEAARRSQFRSIELITKHLLQTETSAQTRSACAGYWRRFVHDFFPHPADLVARAECEVAQLGETVGTPPMGPKSAALARFIGWRRTWRLMHHLGRR